MSARAGDCPPHPQPTRPTTPHVASFRGPVAGDTSRFDSETALHTRWPSDGGVGWAHCPCASSVAGRQPPRSLFKPPPNSVINAMSGHNKKPPTAALRSDLESEYRHLAIGCRQLGVTVVMFRTAKYLFNISALFFALYLVEMASLDPFTAAIVATVLISGPETLELYLVKQGILRESSEGATASDGGD